MYRINRTTLSLLLSLSLLLPMIPVHADSELIPADQIEADTINYKTAKAEYGDYIIETDTSGHAYIPVQQTVLYEGDTAKYVETLVKKNDIVEVGDPLFSIEIDVDEIDLQEKELHLQRTKESYQDGLHDYDKDINKAVSNLAEIEDEYERKKADLQIRMMKTRRSQYVYEMEKDIAEQEEVLQEIYNDKETSYITAPVSGTIYDLSNFSEGDLIRNGASIAVIADITSALVYVSSSCYTVGTQVTISANVQRQELKIPGTVVISSLSIPEMSASGGTLIRLNLSALGDLSRIDPRQLQQMMNIGYARLDVSGISTNMKNLLLIPTKAYTTDGDHVYVNILDKDNMLHKRYIKLGISDRDKAWVLLGLQDGDSVVIGK